MKNIMQRQGRTQKHPEGLTEAKEEFALSLFAIGAIKFGAFRLKLHETNPDAPLSPIYINLRLLQSYPYAIDKAVATIEEMSKNLQFDLYAGIPEAAIPMVAVLSNKNRKPMITPRPPKTHGIGGGIDGNYEPGQTVLVIDDLVTKADSKLEAIKSLEDKSLVVKDIVVLVDREQGGPRQLTDQGYSLHSAFKLSQLLNFYLRVGKIDEEKFKKVMNYLSS